MVERDRLAGQFEANRSHLRAVAYRMLGSQAEADDAVQETWLRLHRADASEVRNLSGWLTTVTGRVCLDMLRARSSRREEAIDDDAIEIASGADPGHDAELADAVGPALMTVLATLGPSERLAFVLHDLFQVPFDEIAVILDRTPDSARQLASRARRRVRGETPAPVGDLARQREAVSAFLQASRSGDFEALLSVLDPDVTLRIDQTAFQMGMRTGFLTQPELRGADAVAKQFFGKAAAAQIALIDGVPGAVWATRGTPRVVFGFTVQDGRVVEIELIADPERLGRFAVEILT